MDWSTFTNSDLLAVDPSTLSPDDLQTYREEMNRRGLSTIPPPVLPTTPAPLANSFSLESGGGVDYELGVEDDGSLITTKASDATNVNVHVKIPVGIVDGQVLVYDSGSNRMVAGTLPTTHVAPGDALVDDDPTSGLPLNAEDGVSWMTADTVPDWLVADSTGETLTDETGALALTGG